jgi:6-phosphofructokinase
VEFNVKKIFKNLKKRGVTQLYVVGGSGSHKGLEFLRDYAHEKEYEI